MASRTDPLRHRIKDHRRVRAGDLVAHENNYRTHPKNQVAALQALYDEVGFARSLLAYELPDGRLKLIDGHLRRAMHPDEVVEVEVLDVNDEEARKLLLSLDPMAALAGRDEDVFAELQQLIDTDNDALRELWQLTQHEETAIPEDVEDDAVSEMPRQFLIVITCTDEAEQRDLLERFSRDGLSCKALLG